MGVIINICDVQPICGDCGIALCYGISQIEYEEQKEFWNNWKCDTCNPNYLREERRKKYYDSFVQR